MARSNRTDDSTVSPWPGWIVYGCPVVLTVGGLLLCWISVRISPFVDPRFRGEKIGLVVFLFAQFSIYAVVVWGIVRYKFRMSLSSIVVWALVMRAVLLPSTPILETDYCRYLWDGLVLLHGYSPYQYAPDEITAFESDRHQFPPVLWDELDALNQLRQSSAAVAANFERINHADIPTIYMPVAQVGFALAAAVSPGQLWGWRMVVLLADVLVLRLLVRLLQRMKQPMERLAIYAWSPLVLKEYINTTHYDVLMLAFMLLAFVCLLPGESKDREKIQQNKVPLWDSRIHALGAGVCLAAATLVKLAPLVVVPLWFRRLGVRGVVVFLGMVLVGIVCFMGLGESTWKTNWSGQDDRRPGFTVGRQMFAGLAAYGEHWEFNSSLVGVLEQALERVGVPEYGDPTARKIVLIRNRAFRMDAFYCAKLIALGLFAMVWLVALIRVWRSEKQDSPTQVNRTLLAATLYVMGAVLLCSPVANPWYVGWLVPLLVFVPSRPWLLLTGMTFLYYLYFLDGCYLPGVRWLEYLPVYVWLMIEGLRWIRIVGVSRKTI